MNIKYVGPRAIISQHGISFKDGKEDKYVYLNISTQILLAIDKDYNDYKTYSYDILLHKDEIDIKSTLLSYENNIVENINKEIENYKIHFKDEIDSVNQNNILSQDDKEAWVNNINIMKKYRIQRAINKIYYMHNIEQIKKVILREKIKEVDTPFSERYWHVLQTIQGSLEQGKHSTHTRLETASNNDDETIAKLFVDY